MGLTLDEAYRELGVSPDASQEEVKRAYKRAALRTHPDKNSGDPDAKAKFQRVSEAYKRITDPHAAEDDEFADVTEEEMFAMFNTMFGDFMEAMFGDLDLDGLDFNHPPPGLHNPFEMLAMMMGMGEEDVEDLMHKFAEDEEESTGPLGQDFPFSDMPPPGMMETMMMGAMMGGFGGLGDLDDLDDIFAGGGGVPGMPEMPSSMMEKMMLEAVLGGGEIPFDVDEETEFLRSKGDGPGLKTNSKRKKKKKKKKPESKIPKENADSVTLDEIEKLSELMARAGLPGMANAFKEAPATGIKPNGSAASKWAEPPTPSYTAPNNMAPPVPPFDETVFEKGLLDKKKERIKTKEQRHQDTEAASDNQKGAEGSIKDNSSNSFADQNHQTTVPKSNTITDDGSLLTEGSTVIVRGKHRGLIRYVGEVDYASGKWYGVQLEEPAGKNNGTVKGRQYFSCAKNYGLIVRPYEVTAVN